MEADQPLVLALVWARLAEHPEYYCSWVKPFTQLRWVGGRMNVCRVGGHWRRMALWANVLPNLASVCKFEKLASVTKLEPRVGPLRLKWDENGEWVPPRYRTLVYV